MKDRKEYLKDYKLKHKQEIKEKNHIWYENNKEKQQIYSKNYYNEHREEMKKSYITYHKNNKEHIKDITKKYKYSDKGIETRRKWINSENGKLSIKKYNQSKKGKQGAIKKVNKRRRNLRFIQISDNIIEEEIEWHHIDNNYMVALPKDLHHLYMGKNHRENTMEIVKQLYPYWSLKTHYLYAN